MYIYEIPRKSKDTREQGAPSSAHPTQQRSAAPCGAVPCCARSFVHIKRVRTRIPYVHAASGLFSYSMELLAFASRLFAPTVDVWAIYLYTYISIYLLRSILPCERA